MTDVIRCSCQRQSRHLRRDILIRDKDGNQVCNTCNNVLKTKDELDLGRSLLRLGRRLVRNETGQWVAPK